MAHSDDRSRFGSQGVWSRRRMLQGAGLGALCASTSRPASLAADPAGRTGTAGRQALFLGVKVRAGIAGRPAHKTEVPEMFGSLLHWAVVFLIVALVAAVLGFGGVAGTAMAGAKLLFWVAIVIFVIMLVAGLVRRG